jgi:hypothetical protein
VIFKLVTLMVVTRSGTDRGTRQRKFDLMSAQHKIEVHRTDITLDGSDPFGRLVSGSIKLRGWTKIGVVVPTTFTSSFLSVEDPVSRKETAKFVPDNPLLWNSLASPTTDIEEYVAESSGTRIESLSTVGSGNTQSVFKKSSIELSSFLSKKIKCLCIDYFPVCSWVALAIEKLPPEHTEQYTGMWTPTSKYNAYRRIGLAWYSSIVDADFEWFKDSPWDSIELF